jgi:hypothetical protein
VREKLEGGSDFKVGRGVKNFQLVNFRSSFPCWVRSFKLIHTSWMKRNEFKCMILRFLKLGFLKAVLLNPTRRVNPGPGQPGTRSTRWLDRSGFTKRPVGATARSNPGEPGRDPVFFFFKCEIWNPLVYNYIYSMSQEKSHVFSMWDKKTFWFKYFNLKG